MNDLAWLVLYNMNIPAAGFWLILHCFGNHKVWKCKNENHKNKYKYTLKKTQELNLII